ADVPLAEPDEEADEEANSIVNLYDAFGTPPDGMVHAFGFSALIRYRGKTILFDAGSDASTFRRNVRALGVRLGEVDLAVLSHAHADHFSGFAYFREMNPTAPIYAPADPFLGGRVAFDVRGSHGDAGNDLPPEQRYFDGDEQRMEGFESSGILGSEKVVYLEKSAEIAPGITLIVTRSDAAGYFVANPQNADEVEKIGLPELSLALSTTEGDVLVVGCAHSGIETIIVEARKLLGRPIDLVAGGYHLIPHEPRFIRALAAWMREKPAVRQVAPAHCTGHAAFAIFRELYGDNYRFLGLGARVPFAP
ncbi:MAG: MBL fold metallo-hydrolase, partial [Candidatus Binatia bacterium]